MKDRILQIMEREGVSNAEFAEKIGISTSSLSHIFNGRNKPSLEVVMRIHKAYPEINLYWLLYGEGEMEEALPSQVPQNSENMHPVSVNFDFENDRGFENGYNPSNPADRETVKYIEKPHPKITEIRIFFDNGTYEVFKPEKHG